MEQLCARHVLGLGNITKRKHSPCPVESGGEGLTEKVLHPDVDPIQEEVL